MEFMRGLDWSPLLISLKTGVVATILSFFGGIFAARQVIKVGPKTKAVLDGILTLPMVLPPTVAGFFLLLIFSLRRPFGAALYEGCVITGKFTTYVGSMPMNATGYLKLTDITAK